jgi:hypothetical protein
MGRHRRLEPLDVPCISLRGFETAILRWVARLPLMTPTNAAATADSNPASRFNLIDLVLIRAASAQQRPVRRHHHPAETGVHKHPWSSRYSRARAVPERLSEEGRALRLSVG